MKKIIFSTYVWDYSRQVPFSDIESVLEEISEYCSRRDHLNLAFGYYFLGRGLTVRKV